MSEDIKKALVGVMDGLVSAYDEERKVDPEWKKLFAKTEGLNFKSLLREVEHQMLTIALDTYSLIEAECAKVGKNPHKEAYNIITALPYLARQLEKHATKTEYSACCVDKSFYILNKALQPENKEMNQSE